MKSSRILLLSTIILCACSTKNKGFISRAYHNTTARYNGYFNARESIKEGFNEYKKTREEDFDKILPVFIVPNEDEASALFPNMNRAIEKTEKVITRHSMEIGGKEYCRWIDDNYLAKGIAHFYKREYKEATSTFSFIAKRYPEEKSKAYSLGWLALTHIENDQLNEASLVIPPLNKLSDLKRKANLFRQKVNAQYYIERENYEEALSAIGQAIGLERKRRNKIRLYYIKAQLHQRMDNSNEAIAAYRFVVKKSPDYDLAFNAGISQATAVKGSANSFSVKKDLEKLLKDDKNIEYHDQIYYALAEIAFTERDYDQAVYLLKESIKASIDNDRQKGKSFLRLAKYFYEEKLYQPASVFYDSTLNILPTEHPEYEEIKSTAKNLQELVVHLNKVDLNDSLLALANLPPKDLDKKLNEIRRNERERILREQREQELKAQLASKKASKSGNSSGSWYFYNNKTKEQGFKAFKETWGDRPLEDNWRRSSRGGFSSPAGEDEDLSESGPSESFGELAGLPSLKELRDPIPQTPSQKQKLIQETKDALYQSGLVYKENFQDFDNAIESFENLLSRYDTTFYRLPAYYQLYRLYLQKENQSGKEFFSFDTKSSSFYYKDLILYEYPESEFALLINNPAAIKEKSESNEEALKAYREAYGTYTSDSLDLAMGMVNKALKEFGENRITPKFYFLKARIHAEQKSISEFESALEFLSKQYAQTEEGKEAKRLLALLQKSLAERAKESEATKDGETSAGSKTENNATSPTETVFVEEPSARHFYIVHVPEESVNSNRAKVEVSNFNGRYFANKRLDISMTYLSNDKPILIVKGLKDKEEAITYHKAFIKDETELRVISRKELTSFGISEGNFKTLFVNKQLDDYVAFFEKNYGN